MPIDKTYIPEILEELTLDEKLSLLTGGNPFSSRNIDRLNIPSIFFADGHNGLNLGHLFMGACHKVLSSMEVEDIQASLDRLFSELMKIDAASEKEFMLKFFRCRFSEEDLEPVSKENRDFIDTFLTVASEIFPEHLPTCFPVGINMASSWDPELVALVAETVSEEARYFGIDVLLGPNINIHRDPRCGRLFESFSEDPFLTGEIAAAFIKGAQKTGVHANAKHFACNNQETERRITDARVSERAMREIYLPGFKKAVTQGKCRTIMPAYNKVNGQYCTENHFLLKQVLRTEWDFDGLLISDWGAVYHKTEALLASNDLEMPGPTDRQELKNAIGEGRLSEDVVNRSVRRILETVADSNTNRGRSGLPFDPQRSYSVARKCAAESLVLLKNNGLFPLENQTIAVMGRNAVESFPTGKGSAGVISERMINIKDGLEQQFETVLDGSNFSELAENDQKKLIGKADVFLFCIGELWGEGSDRPSVLINDEMENILAHTVPLIREQGKKWALLLNVPGPLILGQWADMADAILCLYYPGGDMGLAVADVLSGMVNPSGRLTVSWPRQLEDVPAYLTLPGSFQYSNYGEDIFVGYRYYDTKRINPLFPFGHGLSYTDFEYADLKLSIGSFSPEKEKELRIRFTLTNKGKRTGKEVVQLYVSDIESTLPRPEKELKRFRKEILASGEKRQVEFTLNRDDFAFYDTHLKRWVVEPGLIRVSIGASSRDIRLQGDFTIDCPNPYPPGLQTPIIKIIRDPGTMSRLGKYLPDGWQNEFMIRQELIYYQEMPLEKCLRTHVKNALSLSDEQLENLVANIRKELDS